MNTTYLSYQNNDEMTSIMNKKFAAQFKPEADSFYVSNEPNFNIINLSNIDENNYEYKLNQMTLLYPSIPKEKIEQILKNNIDITLEKGIELLKDITISDNSRNEIILNNNRSIFSSYKIGKRNYNSLLSQTQAINTFPKENNLNNNSNLINTNNNNINNKNEVNSRINIFENNNKEKVNEEERKKLELKTVDKIAEELLKSKNKDELKKYLFIQLAFLESKTEKERKKAKIKNMLNNLDTDFENLNHCLNVNARALNRLTSELSRNDNKIKELDEKINKVKDNIKYYENLVRNYYLIFDIKKMNISN